MTVNEFSSWPQFTEEEAGAVAEVLLSNKVNYWTGDQCHNFEKEFAEWVGAKHAVALANGTVAIEAALKALGVGAGDEVIVTPRTFIASASSIVITGARPVFADVDLNTQNITVDAVRRVLTPKTKAVICVHLAGQPCDMDPIMELANEKSFYVLEDCAQAHGAKYKGKSVGGLGHVAAWSFCQDKIMTTGGEGGMVTTNDSALWSRIWSYKDHGKSYSALNSNSGSAAFRWVHESIGTNFRMTEMQAAIGRIQIRRMEKWHALRCQNAEAILDACRMFPNALRVPDVPESVEHAWYKCYVFVRPGGLKPGWNREAIISEINKRGVPCFSGICPEVYREKAFENIGLSPKERLINARTLGETSLMFLVHPSLTEEEIEKTVMTIANVMQQAGK